MESLGRFWYYLEATQGPHCCVSNFRTTENSYRGRDIWREVPGYLAWYQEPQNVCSSMFVLKMQLYKYKRTRRALIPMILANVKPGTMLYTDGWKVGMFDDYSDKS